MASDLAQIVEVPFVRDPHVARLAGRMARIEGLVEERHPYLVRGRLCECEAFGQRVERPGMGSMGDLDVLTAAHGRGCDIAIVAKRIDARCAVVISEEIRRFIAGM